MASPLVELDDVRVERGGVPVLRGVTAGLGRGEVTALVGLNGSGKSTLLRALVGEFPYTGRVTFRCGHDHSRPRPDAVGYVPQRLAVGANLPITVRDLLTLSLQRGPLFLGGGRRLTKRLPALLARVECADLLDRPVGGLSGGQLQRVLLALALDPSPELLLLDEPAAGIDFRTQRAFYELLAGINRDSGVTVLLVSHDLNLVAAAAHRVWCLRDGVIAAAGLPAEVLAPDAVAGLFGGPPTGS